ncbi:hypothetical protein A33M_0237 [Rhodovulum sp. PH10]|uniref:HlyD family secretion protein n=1 Tax=Rhodovulum sp. PH10 TaxID=1187851 RepID=UPI00027C23D8|nr:efflux RND transporter periplasmic adaptor subunit [Rhodovulum sp. PH10]EJW10300.1 hypothetical protein A33M_0237 [Rhodovulum sp. PH10]
MNMQPPRLGRRPAALLALVATLALPLAGCSEEPKVYQGWVEADLIFVAPDEVGRLQTLAAKEGDHVEAGAPLFTLDDDLQAAEVNMYKAQLENAESAFSRADTLLKTRTGTQKAYDEAEAALRTARARLVTAQTRLDRRRRVSPVTGTVQQVYYRPGEIVPADRPVLAILPPENLKVRFFVPEALLPSIRHGERVRVGCDGCVAGLTAKVSFIARQAEFTPPVIYSLEERHKLVYLIEAKPDDPEKLRVGQPVDVALGTPAPAKAAEARK